MATAGDIKCAPGSSETARSSIMAERNRILEKQNRRLRLTIQKLKRLVYLDALTGLANRRYFEVALESEIRRACRSATPLTLFLCDIDHFKRYNDTFGHQCGDAVLSVLGAALSSYCRRAGDVAFRYGGEEFALLLPGVSASESLLLGERLRCAVGCLSHQYRNAAFLRDISISIGVTTFHSVVPRLSSDVIRVADRALYEAKRAGRNCIKYEAMNTSVASVATKPNGSRRCGHEV